MRREFVDLIIDHQGTSPDTLLFDGSNFRSYGTDTELIVKGYINDYATALSTACTLAEDRELLKTRADLIRTDPYDVNARKVFDEGLAVDAAQVRLHHAAAVPGVRAALVRPLLRPASAAGRAPAAARGPAAAVSALVDRSGRALAELRAAGGAAACAAAGGARSSGS